MKLLERVLTLLRANLSTVLEKTDDPEKVLHQLHIDMRNQLVQVKTQVATAIAENRKLQKHSQEKTAEAETWLSRAEQAVQQGKDNNARLALNHYNRFNKQIQLYNQLQSEQEELVKTMRNALHQLETKIAEVEITIDHLATRKRIALSQQQASEHLNKAGSYTDKEHTTKAQNAIFEMEAHTADLHTRDLNLGQLSVEQQLQNLKAKQSFRQEPPLLSEGHPRSSSPLLRPQAQSGEPPQIRVTDKLHLDELATDPPVHKEIDLDLKNLLNITQKESPAQD